MNKKVRGEMSQRQAERVIETYENAMKNGEEWAHRVLLRRGTEKYQKTIDTLNEAFRVKEVDQFITPIK